MRNILVTGGFGGIGRHVVRNLMANEDNAVTVFDLKNRVNQEVARDSIFAGDKIKILWGDITRPDTYPDVSEFDAIVHMAYIIPPASENLPRYITEKVNVEGTCNFIKHAEECNFGGKFIFASSVSLFGPTMTRTTLVTADDPINPTDVYTSQKARCEEYLQSTSLKWLILRISGAMNLKQDLSPSNLEMLYRIPYDQRFEFIHPMDAALAFSNAVYTDAEREVLIIAGGEKCRLEYNKMIEGLLGVFNIPTPDRSKFTTRAYYLDYYDTTRSQELLKYQTRNFNDFLDDFEENLSVGGKMVRFFGPIAKFFV